MEPVLNVLLPSFQIYNCLQIKLHIYTSFEFGSLHCKKEALCFDCCFNRFLSVLSEIFTVSCILLNTCSPDDFKWNTASMREMDLCSRTRP